MAASVGPHSRFATWTMGRTQGHTAIRQDAREPLHEFIIQRGAKEAVQRAGPARRRNQGITNPKTAMFTSTPRSLTFVSAGFTAACFFMTFIQMPDARSEMRLMAAEAVLAPSAPSGARQCDRGNISSPASMPYPGSGMLAFDEYTQVSVVTRRIESMLRTAEAPLAAVCPRGLRDPDGTLGIFIVSNAPLVTPEHTPGMNDRKAWVVMSALAAVKYGSDCPTRLDYLGLTDPRGMKEHWYYRISFQSAKRVLRELCTGRLSLESAYAALIADWKRVGDEAEGDLAAQSLMHP